jgi:uncharacterized DUF497 family protein
MGLSLRQPLLLRGCMPVVPAKARCRLSIDSGGMAGSAVRTAGHPSGDATPSVVICIRMCMMRLMRYTWNEAKRKRNLKKHGLDFADAEKVFNGPLVLIEDKRESYGEQRMIGIGLLDFLVVLVVHVESDEEIRIISMRKADRDETDLYYENSGYF